MSCFTRLCGHGGIGRRVTLRSLWAKPVEVQVFLAAPLFLLFYSFFDGFAIGEGPCSEFTKQKITANSLSLKKTKSCR